jgi:hypothetical protein
VTHWKDYHDEGEEKGREEDHQEDREEEEEVAAAGCILRVRPR